MPYPQWLQQWQAHRSPIPLFNNITLAAGFIYTPLIPAAWRHNLKHHPHQNLVEYFLQSITLGFRIGSDGKTTQSAEKISKVQQIIQL